MNIHEYAAMRGVTQEMRDQAQRDTKEDRRLQPGASAQGARPHAKRGGSADGSFPMPRFRARKRAAGIDEDRHALSLCGESRRNAGRQRRMARQNNPFGSMTARCRTVPSIALSASPRSEPSSNRPTTSFSAIFLTGLPQTANKPYHVV